MVEPIKPTEDFSLSNESAAHPDRATEPTSGAEHNGLRADTLAASFIILLVLMVVQRGIGFLRGVLFCKWLDPEQLGQWDMAFGFLMLASPVIMFGLPGSFGRYVEYYRKQGQLRDFLFRIGRFVIISVVVAVIVCWIFRDALAELIFGSREFITLAATAIICLAAVATFGYLSSLLIALRQVRVAAVLNFAHGLLFAGIGVTLLLVWRTDATGVVIAFGAASGLVAAVGVVWIARLWRALSKQSEAGDNEPLTRGRTGSLWRKVAPFAFWIWVTNWVGNLFYIVDRVMIIHFGGFGDEGALAIVGQYHTARIFPVLFISVAEILSTTAMPHLSADWESGDRPRVVQRIGSLTTLIGLGMMVASLGVLVVAPYLFEYVWGGRYDAGLSVLPWTLAISVWMSMLIMADNYLLCAEHSRWVCLPLTVGLCMNVIFNLLLLPIYGLMGAVWATAIGAGCALIIQAFAAHHYGMRYKRRTAGIVILPLLLGINAWAALIATGIMIYATRSDWFPIAVEQLPPLWLRVKKFFMRSRQSA